MNTFPDCIAQDTYSPDSRLDEVDALEFMGVDLYDVEIERQMINKLEQEVKHEHSQS